MTTDQKLNWQCALIYIAGFMFLLSVDWRICVGTILIVWANNVERMLERKRQERDRYPLY